jgi:hypothetical protein
LTITIVGGLFFLLCFFFIKDMMCVYFFFAVGAQLNNREALHQIEQVRWQREHLENLLQSLQALPGPGFSAYGQPRVDGGLCAGKRQAFGGGCSLFQGSNRYGCC